MTNPPKTPLERKEGRYTAWCKRRPTKCGSDGTVGLQGLVRRARMSPSPGTAAHLLPPAIFFQVPGPQQKGLNPALFVILQKQRQQLAALLHVSQIRKQSAVQKGLRNRLEIGTPSQAAGLYVVLTDEGKTIEMQVAVCPRYVFIKELLQQRDCFDFSSQHHLLTISLINRRRLFRGR